MLHFKTPDYTVGVMHTSTNAPYEMTITRKQAHVVNSYKFEVTANQMLCLHAATQGTGQFEPVLITILWAINKEPENTINPHFACIAKDPYFAPKLKWMLPAQTEAVATAAMATNATHIPLGRDLELSDPYTYTLAPHELGARLERAREAEKYVYKGKPGTPSFLSDLIPTGMLRFDSDSLVYNVTDSDSDSDAKLEPPTPRLLSRTDSDSSEATEVLDATDIADQVITRAASAPLLGANVTRLAGGATFFPQPSSSSVKSKSPIVVTAVAVAHTQLSDSKSAGATKFASQAKAVAPDTLFAPEDRVHAVATFHWHDSAYFRSQKSASLLTARPAGKKGQILGKRTHDEIDSKTPTLSR